MGEKSTKKLKKLEADEQNKLWKYDNYDKAEIILKMKKGKQTIKKKTTFSEELKQNGSQCSPLPG